MAWRVEGGTASFESVCRVLPSTKGGKLSKQMHMEGTGNFLQLGVESFSRQAPWCPEKETVDGALGDEGAQPKGLQKGSKLECRRSRELLWYACLILHKMQVFMFVLK